MAATQLRSEDAWTFRRLCAFIKDEEPLSAAQVASWARSFGFEGGQHHSRK